MAAVNINCFTFICCTSYLSRTVPDTQLPVWQKTLPNRLVFETSVNLLVLHFGQIYVWLQEKCKLPVGVVPVGATNSLAKTLFGKDDSNVRYDSELYLSQVFRSCFISDLDVKHITLVDGNSFLQVPQIRLHLSE